jgi:hypothetical protein
MTNEGPQPAPSGLGAILSIVQAVVAIVPRWLVVAAGVIFLTWLAFDLYLNTRAKLAQTEQTEAASLRKKVEVQGMEKLLAAPNSPPRPARKFERLPDAVQ